MTLTHTKYKITINSLTKGDPLSITLFNVVLDAAVKVNEIQTTTIYNQRNQVMTHADNIILIARTEKKLKC